MTMKTAARAKVDPTLREEWLGTITDLQHQIQVWASDEPGWSTSPGGAHQILEALLGVYTVTGINIHTPDGRLVLEPIARNHPGAGIVELYAWPTLYRVRLVQSTEWGGWRVRTDSGIYLKQEWSRENFITLANDLLTADA